MRGRGAHATRHPDTRTRTTGDTHLASWNTAMVVAIVVACVVEAAVAEDLPTGATAEATLAKRQTQRQEDSLFPAGTGASWLAPVLPSYTLWLNLIGAVLDSLGIVAFVWRWCNNNNREEPHLLSKSSQALLFGIVTAAWIFSASNAVSGLLHDEGPCRWETAVCIFAMVWMCMLTLCLAQYLVWRTGFRSSSLPGNLVWIYMSVSLLLGLGFGAPVLFLDVVYSSKANGCWFKDVGMDWLFIYGPITFVSVCNLVCVIVVQVLLKRTSSLVYSPHHHLSRTKSGTPSPRNSSTSRPLSLLGTPSSPPPDGSIIETLGGSVSVRFVPSTHTLGHSASMNRFPVHGSSHLVLNPPTPARREAAKGERSSLPRGFGRRDDEEGSEEEGGVGGWKGSQDLRSRISRLNLFLFIPFFCNAIPILVATVPAMVSEATLFVSTTCSSLTGILTFVALCFDTTFAAWVRLKIEDCGRQV
ncbi:hypothetical protein HDU96_005425 [Phlyctochytrium bullatum]|nr:hypothetical protein HDU96_005425 [Phlyctochytrium bullatum]